jgi:hypothetical protein
MMGTTTAARLLACLLLPAFLALPTLPTRAQEPGRAGLVVQFGEIRVEARCLEVPAEGAKGVDLLNASGLEVVADVSSGMGISVCQVEGQGCAYPTQHCFCQCMGGGECAYWNYFYREPGAETWTYSPLGAVLHTVLPGSVEAWVWGDGRTPPAAGLTFEAICQSPTAVAIAAATATATPRPTREASPSPAAAAGAASPAVTPAPPASATPGAVATTAAAGPGSEVTASPTPGSAPANGAAGAGGYLAFAAMLLFLAAVGVVTWLRRR